MNWGILSLPLLVLLIGPTVGPTACASGLEIDATAFVTRIIDGDTFVAEQLGRVRLADIDAPEVGEIGAAAATAYLNSLAHRRWVHLDVDGVLGTDVYGRLVAVAYVRHNTTHLLNVNMALAQVGLARVVDFPNDWNPASWSLYVLDPVNNDPAAGTREGVYIEVALVAVATVMLAAVLLTRYKR